MFFPRSLLKQLFDKASQMIEAFASDGGIAFAFASMNALSCSYMDPAPVAKPSRLLMI
jgi:hypothetical protein